MELPAGFFLHQIVQNLEGNVASLFHMQIDTGQAGHQTLAKDRVVKANHAPLQTVLVKGLYGTGGQHIGGCDHPIGFTLVARNFTPGAGSIVDAEQYIFVF